MVGDPAEWQRGRTPAELAADRDAALAEAPDLDGKARGSGGSGTASSSARGPRDPRPERRAGGVLGRAVRRRRGPAPGADRVARDELDPILPRTGDGLPVPSALLALGKCGGRELGFGSDLELMLVYDDRDVAGPAGAALRPLRHGAAAGARRPRGGTFDVDFRLRPYGRAGPPATALSAFADYYRAGGPAWGYERQALIKLRAVAGDPRLGREVEELRDRFVYGPEPFDLDGCRRLRRLQVEQLVRPGTVNAKYSPGALVDVEYFVQALQIIHGGAEPAVRTPSTLRAIAALEAAGRLTPDRAGRLRSAYLLPDADRRPPRGPRPRPGPDRPRRRVGRVRAARPPAAPGRPRAPPGRAGPDAARGRRALGRGRTAPRRAG